MNDVFIICHHGIRGQKWGVKNGPPYPLGQDQKSYAEVKLARVSKTKRDDSKQPKQQDNDGSSAPNTQGNKQGLSLKDVRNFYDAHEREIKIGAGIVASSLAMYGAYRLYKTMPADHLGVDTYATNKPLIETLSTYRDKAVDIPAGTAFKRISREAMEDYANVGSAYVSYKLRDTAKYVSASSNKLSFPGGSRDFIHTLKSTKTVKVPSAREMAEIYLKQHPNATDQQFRSMITYGFVQWDADELSDPIVASFKKQAAQFKDEVVRSGYGAIVDLEDAGKQIESPLILLSLDDFDISSSKIREYERVVSDVIKRAA